MLTLKVIAECSESMDKMIENTDKLSNLICVVEDRFGRKPKTPGDFNELLISINSVTGRNLSLSTIKRLWNYVNYPHKPSIFTLTTLSQYAGFPDWESFRESPQKKDSDFITEGHDLNDMLPGVTITLKWDHDKGCVIRHKENKRFIVIKSYNIKLKEGDELTAEFFSTGQPIYMTNIVREGKTIPLYIAAKRSGLKFIKFET